MSTGGINGPTGPRRTGATSSTQAKGSSVRKTSDSASLSNSAGLDTALMALPDARPEAVARATTLANDPQYPPPSTIKELSRFLAAKLTPPAE